VGAALAIVLCACASSPEARRDRFLSRAKAFTAKREYSRALLEFRNAAQAMPRDPEIYYQLGMAAGAAGDIPSAVAAFQKALDVNPKHAASRMKMAELMARASDKGLLEEAESRLKPFLDDPTPDLEAMNSLALAELKLGKQEDGIQTLETALARAPQELSSSILLAQAKLQKRDVTGAEAVLKQACAAAPRSAEPRIILGRFYRAQGKTQEAMTQFEDAARIDPKNAPALIDLASAQMALGKDAEQTYRRAAHAGDEKYEHVHALFLFQQGRRDDAIHEFETLAKNNPEDHSARIRLIEAYEAVGREADAKKVLDEALRRNPKDLDAVMTRAQMLFAEKKYSEAESDVNRVLHLDSASAPAHYLMARLELMRGSSLSYRQELSQILQSAPYLLSVRLELAQNLVAERQPGAALEILDAAPPAQKELVAVLIQRNWILWAMNNLSEMRKGIDLGLSKERSAGLLLQDGLWKLRSGHTEGGRAALQEALKLNPSDLRALAALSESFKAQKQNRIALQTVQDYASSHPKSAPAQAFLGEMLVANGDRTEARSAFLRAKAADPDYINADLSLIQLDALDQRWEDASGKLKKVLANDAGNITARLWLGDVEATQGNYEGALEDYRRVLASSPNNPSGLNNVAYLLLRSGKGTDEALKDAQKARELAPDDPDVADTLGWILYQKGLYPSAVEQLKSAVASGRSNPIWQYHLAMAYAKNGDLPHAQDALAVALKQNPGLPESRMAIQVVGK